MVGTTRTRRDVGRILASPKLALVVMILLAGVSAAGGIFHQAGILSHTAYAALWGILCLTLGACTLRRWRWNADAILSSATHVGFLTLAAGFGWAAVSGEEGVAHFTLGNTVSRLSVSGDRSSPLGFSMRLDGIEEEYDPMSHDILRVALARKGKIHEIPLAGRREISLDGAGYKFHVLKTTERFSEEPSIPVEVRRDMAIDAPALLLEVSAPGKPPDRRWLFADRPHVNVNRPIDPDMSLALVRRRYVKQANARFILKEPEENEKTVSLAFNAPLRHAGFQFCLAGYDSQRRMWARVHVKKDSGAPAIVGGMILTCLGVLYRLLVKPLGQRVSARKSSAPVEEAWASLAAANEGTRE